MLALVLTLSLSAPAPQTIAPWRLVSRPDLHVGLRPALFVSSGELDAGLTVQVTARAITW